MSTYPLHLFVIAGQSNAVGRAPLPETQDTSPNILKWNSGAWLPGIEPTTPGGLYSFAESFGVWMLGLLDDPGYTIGLIPCAVGGTSIAQWQRGQAPYSDCVALTQAALAASPGASVDAIIFYQGEDDTFSAVQAAAWPAAFVKFFKDFRADAQIDLHTPVVYAEIGPNPNDPARPAWAYLQSLQVGMENNYANVKLFDCRDLTTLPAPNQIHLNVTGQTTAGRRAANVYYNNFIP